MTASVPRGFRRITLTVDELSGLTMLARVAVRFGQRSSQTQKFADAVAWVGPKANQVRLALMGRHACPQAKMTSKDLMEWCREAHPTPASPADPE